ncbi:peptidase S8/S53 domain-containing protein [Rhizoctonia solani]|nr:peptidase S8/S53 domain-containing protein [Rhizoctonia solani]
MLFKSLVLVSPAVILAALAAPSGIKVPILKHAGKVKENSYIIQLKPEVSKPTHLARLSASKLALIYTYDQAFHGYAARLDTDTLESIRQSKEVEAIFEDGIIETDITPPKRDSGSPSVASKIKPENIRRADPTSVDIYDIGTGIYTAHTSFGGRAHWGATFGGYSNTDGNGYDTCLAGIAIGATYGVATQANIYAVRAMADSGSAAISDIIAAINWIISAATASGRPSVTMLGSGGSVNSALDSAVASATSKGMHFIVPAPSSGSVGNTSPARVPSAVTVGVAGQSYFPLTGIDVCSKGTAIPCPSIQGPTASITISGAGAAMARVAGIVAAVLGTHGSLTPAAMEAALKVHASTSTNGCLVINEPW